jgi:acyl-CoA dehydrogenase
MFLEALEKVLADTVTSAAIRQVEAGGSADGLWQPIEAAGFLDLMLPEAHGGAGLPLADLFPILECLGRHGMPLPVAQSMVARALVGGQATLPPGMVTLALQLQRPAGGRWRSPQVPGGQVASHVLVADGEALLVLDATSAQREPVGDPRSLVANLSWSEATPLVRMDSGGGQLAPFAAALMAAQLSGAMQRCFDMALVQCNTRVQFGKSIGKFQALQQQLSVMAEHVLAAAIAAEASFRSTGPAPEALAAAVAKSRTSEAVGVVAATAHAVHGAIGMTDEFDLGLITRRLHDWRLAYGAEHVWNLQIGARVLDSDQSLSDLLHAV